MGTMGLQRMLSAVAALIGFVCMILFSSILHQKHLASGRYTSSFDLLLQPPHPAYTTLRRNQHLTKQSAFTTHLQEMLSKRRGQLRKRSIENKVQLVFLQQTDRTQPIFRVRSKYLAKQNHHEPDTLSRFKLRKTTSQIRNPCVPNLLVIGAQKAGTTSWHIYMKNGYHPNIIVPKGRKECDYFSYKLDEDSPFGNYTTMFAGNTAAGSALKGRCKLAYDNNYQPILRAEASPNYLVHPWAASRAKTWLPDTKILVILREPISRIISAFNMKWQERLCGLDAWRSSDCHNRLIRNGSASLSALRSSWQRELDQTVRKEIEQLRKCYSTIPPAKNSRWFKDKLLVARYRSVFRECHGLPMLKPYALWEHLEDKSHVFRSIYIDQLLQWFHHFDDRSIMIWSAEEFESSPKTLLRHSVRWLGLDENRVNEAAVHGKHHSRQYIASILPETKRLLQDFFRPHNQRLFTFLEAKGYYDTAKTLRIQFDKI